MCAFAFLAKNNDTKKVTRLQVMCSYCRAGFLFDTDVRNNTKIDTKKKKLDMFINPGYGK